VDVGCGKTVAVTVAVDGVLVGVGLGLVVNVGLGAEVVVLGEDALEDSLEGGLPRVGVVGLFSVRVGAGCSIVVVGDAVMVRDRDTVGAVMESPPSQETTSTAARPMTAARETSVSAPLGTCRCLVVIVDSSSPYSPQPPAVPEQPSPLDRWGRRQQPSTGCDTWSRLPMPRRSRPAWQTLAVCGCRPPLQQPRH
jgi:hypothetical protein